MTSSNSADSTQRRQNRPRVFDLAAFERRWNEGLGCEAWEITRYFGFGSERAVKQQLHALTPAAKRGRIKLYTRDQVRQALGGGT